MHMSNSLKKIYLSLFSAALLLTFGSCEKVIDVKLNTSASQIVIEGVINDQAGPKTITLSKSVPYTDSNVYPAVTGAQVTVTDETNRIWNFVETSPGKYTVSAMRGVPGRTYTMRVVAEGETYTASSTMPAVVKLDALSIKILSFGNEDYRAVEVHYKDPANIANQYRWVMKVNGVQIKAVFADNDRLTDGNDVVNVLFYSDDENEELEIGDQVDVEMQSIDKNVFNYWFTLSQQTQNGPGGGVTPGNPPSNIDNGALGYFSAHTYQTKTLRVN